MICPYYLGKFNNCAVLNTALIALITGEYVIEWKNKGQLFTAPVTVSAGNPIILPNNIFKENSINFFKIKDPNEVYVFTTYQGQPYDEFYIEITTQVTGQEPSGPCEVINIEDVIFNECDNNNTGNAGGVNNKYIAGEEINGGKVLILQSDGKVYKYDIGDLMHMNKYIGVSTHAASIGDEVNVCSFGIMDYDNSFPIGSPLFIGLSGSLSLSSPNVGNCKQVAISLNINKIILINHAEMHLIP